MITDIQFSPLVPLVLVATLAAVSLVLILLALWRRLPGWWLRALASILLLVAIANPSLRQEQRKPLSDIVFVVVDRSSSQQIAGRPDQTDSALAALKEKLGRIGNVDVRTVIVGDAPPDSDAGTLAMTALARAAAEVPRNRIAGAVLITDGQVHDMQLAPDMPAPVNALLTGKPDDWDRRLVIINAPAFAILGEPVTLRLKIEDKGKVPAALAGSTTLKISIDGAPAQSFNVRIGQELELPLRLAHGGQNVVQFSVPKAEGELTERNNRAVVAINGVRDRLRVLLVSGEPHAGERTWRNLLKSDSSVDLVHFTILRPPGKQDGVPVNELSLIAFPTRELFMDKIDQFDLIIFDRYRLRGILPPLYLQNVARYVQDGGAVLVAAGPAFAGVESIYRSPLAQILPGRPTARVYEKGFVPRLSRLGLRHPVTRGLPDYAPRPPASDGTPGWGRWFRMIDIQRIRGQVVMTGPDDKPLLILDRVGKGRVALLASDQAWLWSRGFEGGGPQLELLRRLAHWMMKEPELEEETLSASAMGRTVTVVRRSMADITPRLTITAPNGKAKVVAMRQVGPGRYEYRFKGAEDGLYRLQENSGKSGPLKAVAALGPVAPREYEDTVATADKLAPWVKGAHGGVLRLSDGLPSIRLVRSGRPAAGRGWIGITPRNAYVTTGIRLTSLVLPLWFLLAAAVLLVLAWRREGR
ncbi:MAG: hypothetical protein Q9M41_12410 [Paracoccaceae bacterium]|nr:hypothetical protein [Paracoccaceae bacterium]